MFLLNVKPKFALHSASTIDPYSSSFKTYNARRVGALTLQQLEQPGTWRTHHSWLSVFGSSQVRRKEARRRIRKRTACLGSLTRQIPSVFRGNITKRTEQIPRVTSTQVVRQSAPGIVSMRIFYCKTCRQCTKKVFGEPISNSGTSVLPILDYLC